jgi:hypothetical protein
MYIGFQVKCVILNRSEKYPQISVQMPSVKFHEKLSSESYCVSRKWTDRYDEAKNCV